MKDLDVLKELGLTETEAKIYLVLLETGSTLAGVVIRKTGFHRATTYQILQRLKEKGLVSSIIKGKKQYFQAAEPGRLVDDLREKEEKLKDILPDLIARLKNSKEKQEITVYAGEKGIRFVFDKILEELGSRGEYFDFGVSGLFKEILGSYWDLWQKQKKKQKIKSYVIFNNDVKKIPGLLKNYYGETRFYPRQYSSITDTIIYKDKVILFIWSAKPPIAVIINNQDNAESYKNQFKFMWKRAKKN